MEKLEKQKLLLESSKEKIKQKEKMLKEKEKMSARATLSSLGQLFVKTKTSHLDPEILLGALLEIAERSNEKEILDGWMKRAQNYTELSSKNSRGTPLAISFKSHPDVDIRTKLKELKFKWNGFRGEFYGFGDKTILQNLLQESACSIEEMS